MKFEFLPHTADIRMRIEGETLPELFDAGIKGMSHILKENQRNKQGQKYSEIIAVKSADVTCLLIDFLSELLAMSYTKKLVFSEVKFLEFSEQLLSAKVSGSAIDSFDEEIKAVTYHEADIKRNKSGKWETMVVFDI